MANPYFKFKEFTVFQDQCAMKVSTIACVFGAFIQHENPKNILDIGTGTGLLSLMMAQKFQNAQIDAIEIEEHAFRQARDNFLKSKWPSRINAVYGDFLEYAFDRKFDLVISNPPFFKDHLKTGNKKTNLARHNDHFDVRKFIVNATDLLTGTGKYWLLLPARETTIYTRELLSLDFVKEREIRIFNYPDSENMLSVISCFSRGTDNECSESKMIVRQNENEYTEEFKKLLKDYYLYL